MSGSLSLLTQGLTGEGGGGEESGEARVQRYLRLLPQKLNQPIKICSCFLPPRRDRVNSGSVFRRSPRAGLVLLSLFFRCRACSAACGFLFLCAYVGAHFFKLKRRKSKWIVKLVFFFTKAGCLFPLGVGGRLMWVGSCEPGLVASSPFPRTLYVKQKPKSYKYMC